MGVGVGLSLGLGVGVGVGVSLALGVGVGVGVGVCAGAEPPLIPPSTTLGVMTGLGVGVALGITAARGDGVALGDGDNEATGIVPEERGFLVTISGIWIALLFRGEDSGDGAGEDVCDSSDFTNDERFADARDNPPLASAASSCSLNKTQSSISPGSAFTGPTAKSAAAESSCILKIWCS